MQFFQAINGVHYPIDQISTIGSEQKGDRPTALPFHTVRLHGRGFENFATQVSKYEVERILESSAPVISAESGVQLATFHVFSNIAPEEWYATLTPIVAWRIIDGQPEPITIEDDWCRHRSHTAIKMPDGKLVDTDGEQWGSLKEFEDNARGWAIADREEADAA